MLGRILSLVTALLLASASASAYVPERSLLHRSEIASAPKTASRDFAAEAKQAAKTKSAASVCCVWEIWFPPLKLASSMGFTGYYADAESGDYYAQQRYYRQGIGRFLSVDPWEGDTTNPITLNKYLYANGNPLIYLDPDGRQSMSYEASYAYVAQGIKDPEERARYEARAKIEVARHEAEGGKALGQMALVAVPGTLVAKGVWSVGRTAYGAWRMGGWRLAAYETAGAQAAAVEIGAGTAAALTGAELPPTPLSPVLQGARLNAQLGSRALDAELDALEPALRQADEVPSVPLARAADQQSRPVVVVEGDNAASAIAPSVAKPIAANEVVYQHRTETGEINYFGITCDPSGRACRHRLDSEKTGATMEVISMPQTHGAARTVEAKLIRQRLAQARDEGLIDGTEPIQEQLAKAGLVNKNRGREPSRWEAVEPDDVVVDPVEVFDIRTPIKPDG